MGKLFAVCVALLAFIAVLRCDDTSLVSGETDTQNYKRHTSNWAVLLCTSRFWFNYRHIANTLSMYRSVKRLGIPDSQIILMLADDMACNARNPYSGEIFNRGIQSINLYGTDIEVDYRGLEVNVENFIRVLTGRHEEGTPASKRLNSDENSNVFIFMTGHGGEEFLKFQDNEEISSHDIADAVQEMFVKDRYKELFFMVDTCQAGSLSNALYSPNVVTVGSSKLGESSYSHHGDFDVGVSLIDRFTSSTLDFFERVKVGTPSSKATLQDLFSFYNPRQLHSTPDIRADLFQRPLNQVQLTDFFGSVLHVEVSNASYPIAPQPFQATDPQKDVVEEQDTSQAQRNVGIETHNDASHTPFYEKELSFKSNLISLEFLLGMTLFSAAAMLLSSVDSMKLRS